METGIKERKGQSWLIHQWVNNSTRTPTNPTRINRNFHSIHIRLRMVFANRVQAAANRLILTTTHRKYLSRHVNLRWCKLMNVLPDTTTRISISRITNLKWASLAFRHPTAIRVWRGSNASTITQTLSIIQVLQMGKQSSQTVLSLTVEIKIRSWVRSVRIWLSLFPASYQIQA